MAANYELFNKTFVFPGEFAGYVRFLTGNEIPAIHIFDRNLDVYMMGAAVAINKGIYLDHIPSASDDSVKIMGEQFTREAETLTYLYVLAMLSYDGSGFSEKERIERAFRYPYMLSKCEGEEYEKVEKILNACMKTFHKYVLAGTKFLYDTFAPLKDLTHPTQLELEEAMFDFAAKNIDVDVDHLSNLM